MNDIENKTESFDAVQFQRNQRDELSKAHQNNPKEFFDNLLALEKLQPLSKGRQIETEVHPVARKTS